MSLFGNNTPAGVGPKPDADHDAKKSDHVNEEPSQAMLDDRADIPPEAVPAFNNVTATNVIHWLSIVNDQLDMAIAKAKELQQILG